MRTTFTHAPWETIHFGCESLQGRAFPTLAVALRFRAAGNFSRTVTKIIMARRAQWHQLLGCTSQAPHSI